MTNASKESSYVKNLKISRHSGAKAQLSQILDIGNVAKQKRKKLKKKPQ